MVNVPREIYNLAAQSFVSYSCEDDFSTRNTNINGKHYMLAAFALILPNTCSSDLFNFLFRALRKVHLRL